MNYFDITYISYGAGLVIAGWVLGMVVSVLFTIASKIGRF